MYSLHYLMWSICDFHNLYGEPLIRREERIIYTVLAVENSVKMRSSIMLLRNLIID